MNFDVRSSDQPEVYPSDVIRPLFENNNLTVKEEPPEWLISDVRSIPEAQYVYISAEPVQSASFVVSTEQYVKEEFETSSFSKQSRCPNVDKEIKDEKDNNAQSLSGKIKLCLRKTIKRERVIETELQVKHVKDEVEMDFPVEQHGLKKMKTPRHRRRKNSHRTNKVKQPCRSPATEPKFFFKCETCDKVVKHLANFIDHQRIHTGERPYKCMVCKKNFIRNSDLIKHRMVHSKLRLYKCKTCGKKFKLSGALSKHSKVHSDQCPFKCESCDKRFKRSSCLIKHMRSHTEEKPFTCDICNKCFKWEGSLREHRRIHSGEKPFQCPDCKKSFTHLSTFLQHKRIHNEHPLFPCDICDKSFNHKPNLLNHKRRVHK
ncbi:uncharacterized protein LOC142150977 [Mixophyes fleayi]|uniref:uncharacterized protein LOC142150977 n=1 Tax=Mixophyes fleayi TaxID=3061075 RepID=UPI003F4E34ED